MLRVRVFLEAACIFIAILKGIYNVERFHHYQCVRRYSSVVPNTIIDSLAGCCSRCEQRKQQWAVEFDSGCRVHAKIITEWCFVSE